MSKHSNDLLNLSLSGAQITQSGATASSRQNNAKRVNLLSNRSMSSSTNNLSSHKNKIEPKVAPNTNKNTTNSINSSRKNQLLFSKKYEEKDNKNDSKKQNENVFVPLSTRSSTNDFDDYKDLYKTKKDKDDTLEFFFDKGLTIQPNETQKFDYSIINPSTEQSLNKLKSSVDQKRKELQREAYSNQMNEIYFNDRLEYLKRNIAARKIQKWYKRNIPNVKSKQKFDMENLFASKRDKMKMKQSQSSSLIFNKKPTREIPSSYVKSKTSPKQSNLTKADLILANLEKSELKNESEKKKLDIDLSSNVKKIDDDLKSNVESSTVESILFNLNKIERESEDLLKSNSSIIKDYDAKNEHLSSILSYLDETANKDQESFKFKKLNEEKKYDSLYLYEKPESKSLFEKNDTTKMSIKKSTTQQNGNDKVETKKTAKKTVVQQQEEDIEKENEKLKKLMNETKETSKKILNKDFEIEEKNRTIELLEKALNQQRELTIRHTQEADKEMQVRLESQKNDYEAIIQRHLNFIDQLIDDKKNLSEKCESLVKELKDIEKTHISKIKHLEEKCKYEVQKVKDTFEAAEKIRRQTWIDEKTKKIKEMTVKGLEPEIQGLITKHKNEIKTLKAIHEAELLQADERAAQRYIKITEELRENFEREKESSIQKERDIFKQRYEKSLEDEEKSFLEQRRRLYAEIEEEKNRLAEQASFQRKELDRLRKMLEENNLNTIETIKKEYGTTQSELEKKHQNEIQSLKEKLEIEKQSWEQNYLKKQENWVLQKERELKEQVKRERDKEIELLISRLESESALSREEADRTAENRIKRIRDKYESELKEVEKTERETMERYNTLKAKFNELEGEHERLKVLYRQKEKDLEVIKKLTDTLQDERSRLADVLRQDFSDRLVFSEEENKKLKMEIAEINSKHQFELNKKKEEFEKLQREKTEELNTVHEKIKQVVGKKEEAFNQLKQQYEAACKRADHLEELLEQQRTLMLKKQNNNNS